jgi:hypothetical protein
LFPSFIDHELMFDQLRTCKLTLFDISIVSKSAKEPIHSRELQ